MKAYALVFLALVTLVKSAVAVCMVLDCDSPDQDPSTCTISSPKIFAQLPDSLRISEASGGLSIEKGDSTERCSIHTRNNQLLAPLTLDNNYMFGSIKIDGKLRATGTLRFDPNPGGDWFFYPDESTMKTGGNFFNDAFSEINLDGIPSLHVLPPKSLRKSLCWEAQTKIEMNDFKVVKSESCQAGTFAARARLIGKLKSFKKLSQCSGG